MLNQADFALAPAELKREAGLLESVIYVEEGKLFSEMLLKKILDFTKEKVKITDK